MPELFSIEELITDDSFINYCNGNDPEDSSRWEDYLRRYPLEKEKVERAKTFVLGIKKMLHAEEKKKSLTHFMGMIKRQEGKWEGGSEELGRYAVMLPSTVRSRSSHWWRIAAAVLMIAGISLWIFFGSGAGFPETAAGGAIAENTDLSSDTLDRNSHVNTDVGEKRAVWLPDGTKVTLNARSVLRVDSAFGKKTRTVSLEGEAFFNVTHNIGSPFVVRMKDFDVKVLGTMFNVKSYAEDKTSETSLVKGKVEITLHGDSAGKLILNPNEKMVLSYPERTPNVDDRSSLPRVSSVVKPLTISGDGNSVIETGWIQDRLEIDDETFEDLKNTLERQYGVDISFKDEKVKKYRFTATFEKESIDEVLKALQLSYGFNYTKNNNQISIEK